MKNKMRILAVLMIMLLALTACGSTRKTATLEHFQKVCDTENMVEIDSSDIAAAYEGVTECWAAKMTGNDLSATYLTFESNEAALEAYTVLDEALTPGEAGYQQHLDGDNFHSVSNNTFARYTRVIQVDNMVLIFDGSVTYKAEIDKIVSQFGSYPVQAV